jgi:competence protein ComEA
MVVALPPSRASAPVGHSPQSPPQSSGGLRSPRSQLVALVDRFRRDRSFAIKVVASVIIVCALMVSLLVRVLGVSSTAPARRVSVVERLPKASGASAASPAEVLPSSVPAPNPVASSIVPLSPPALPTTASPVRIVVHAAGAITNPGVYVFDGGARVADLVSSAGGPTSDADIDRLNLAAPLNDGTRVYIPFRGKEVPATVGVDGAPSAPSPGGPSTPGSPGNTTPTGKLNLNTATAEQLDALPGVGPATAAAIIEHRTKIGRFRSITQLLDVPGIGEAKLAALRTRVSV